jgi:hypothetical protein
MSQYVETPCRTFQFAAATAQYLRVKDNGSGKLTTAGAVEVDLGVSDKPVLAADDDAAVRLRNAPGTAKMTAAGAISAWATVYGAAGGKIDDTANGNPVGIALEAATADGDVIEVLRFAVLAQNKTVEAHTSDDTLTAAESGSVHTTVGAAGTVTFTMPAAVAGMEFFFRVGAAQELRVDPNGTETIALPSTGVQGAAGKYLTANADGETVHIVCDKAGEWSVYGFTGTWTAEA